MAQEHQRCGASNPFAVQGLIGAKLRMDLRQQSRGVLVLDVFLQRLRRRYERRLRVIAGRTRTAAARPSTRQWLISIQACRTSRACCHFVASRVAAPNVATQGAGRRQWLFPCQVPQRRVATFAAQPFGPGLFLRDAALFVVHLE